jgi:hypothetical protein
MPNRKRDDGYTVARTRGSGQRPWGQPMEVSLDQAGAVRYRWTVLAEDLALRLERTRATRAIAVPLDDPGCLKRAREALWFWFKKNFGKNAVLIHGRIEPDGTATLFVRRGPNWGRYPDKKMEELNE